MLFIIANEVMAVNIRNKSNIKGFCIRNKERKLAQYADDSSLTLMTVESINVAMETIQEYCTVSGMKLNMNKTEGIWLGPLKGNPEYYQGIHFTQTAVRILGVYVGHDTEKCLTENWMSKVNKLKNCIHIWKSRKLTLFGKVQILKSLALSKFVYCMSVLTVPPMIVKYIAKCMYSFLWNSTERIKEKH